MLDEFSLIFVADTKIIFRYDFVAPLILLSLILREGLEKEQCKSFTYKDNR